MYLIWRSLDPEIKQMRKETHEWRVEVKEELCNVLMEEYRENMIVARKKYNKHWNKLELQKHKNRIIERTNRRLENILLANKN